MSYGRMHLSGVRVPPPFGYNVRVVIAVQAVLVVLFLALAWAGLRRAGFFRRESVVGDFGPRRTPTILLGGLAMVGLCLWVGVTSVIFAAIKGFPVSADIRQLWAINLGYLVTIGVVAAGVVALAPGLLAGRRAEGKGPLGAMLRGGVGLVLTLPWLFAVQGLTVALMRWAGEETEMKHPLLKMIEDAGAGDQGDAAKVQIVGLVVVSAVLLAPLFEELVFRGIIQTGLAQMMSRFEATRHSDSPPAAGEAAPRNASAVGAKARWAAIMLSSVGFAILHPMWSWPAIFVLAVALGYVYEREGNLFAPLAMHMGFNGLNVAMALLQLYVGKS